MIRSYLHGVARLTLGLWLIAWAAPLPLQAADLVLQGKPQAQIVVADPAPRTLQLAAQELQACIQKISGAQLPIVHQPTSDLPLRIYVGRSEHTDRLGIAVDDLRFGAFRMKSGPDYLALVGRDSDFTPPPTYLKYEKGRISDFTQWDAKTGGQYGNPIDTSSGYNEKLKLWDQAQRGSLNAVYEFLRSLGARWYMPGEIGECLPQMASIPLPQVDRTVRPDFDMRNLYFMYNTFRHDRTGEESLWHMRLGLNSGADSLGLAGFGHGLLHVIGRNKSDPTMFAVYNGKRSIDSHYGAGAPCLSSEALFQLTVRYARTMFTVYPELTNIDLGPPDGYANLCQCDLCKDKGTPQRGWTGRMSDYTWSFVNRVATELYKTHPDRTVSCVAYSGYLLPPESIQKMSPNVAVILCRWRSDFDDPKLAAQYRDITDAWLRILPSRQFYIWDYYLHSRPNGPTEGVPVYFPQIIADDLRFLRGKSRGEFIEVSRNWPAWNLKWDALAANHLNAYVTSRLYWDAQQELEPMLAEYFEKFYGPAAAEMKAFVEYATAHYRQATKDYQVIDGLSARVQAAKAKAGDSIYGRRVQLLVDFMQPLLTRRDQLAAGRQASPKVRAYHHERGPTLDGKLDEPFWKGFPRHSLAELETGAQPTHATQFQVAWANDSLYFAIVCTDVDVDQMNPGPTQNEDNNIFLGDNIELLLETQTHAYYQIVVSPSGAVIDLDRKGGINTLWSSQAQVATSRKGNQWVVEIRLPVAGDSQEALDANNGISGRQPSETYPWFFNIGRQRVRATDTELSAYSPTGKRSFHETNRFSELFVR
jgi:hypothetical protein